MKKNFIYSIAIAAMLSAALGGCSLSGEPTASESTDQPVPTIRVMSEYGLMDGFTQYNCPDGGFSIQLPEGSVINDDDANDVTITVASDYDNADMINIRKETSGVYLIETADQLRDMLKDDSSIEVTGFVVLSLDGEYKGYKYSYNSIGNDELKGVVSMYMNKDGSAYRVNGIINNGGDAANIEHMNTIVDTFVTYL